MLSSESCILKAASTCLLNGVGKAVRGEERESKSGEEACKTCFREVFHVQMLDFPNIPKTKIRASSPITSRQTDGEIMDTLTDFVFLGSKIAAGDDCSSEIKRCSLEEKL